MFVSLIRNRRSVRKFIEKPVEKEKADLLIEAMLRSPSSKSINPWEFIIVTDKELLKKLSLSKPHGSSFLKWAPMGIVVCGDAVKTDTWIEDASIASIMTQLTAESLGLGSCWIQIRERKHNDHLTAQAYIADLLNIPENMKVESIVAIGYSQDKKPGHPMESLQYEKVFINSHGQPYQK